MHSDLGGNRVVSATLDRRVSRARRGAVLWSSMIVLAALVVGASPVAGAPTGWGGPYSVVATTSEATTIVGVSCATPTYCVAVDATGNTYTYGSFGSAPFLLAKHIDPHVNGNGNTMTGISCPITTFCVAIDSQGYALVFNGVSWGAPTLLDGDGQGSVPLLGVSCASPSFCVVVDAATNAILYQSGTWASPQDIDPLAHVTSDPRVYAVSCSSATDCWAVDGQGNAIMWNGTSWAPPQFIDDGYGSSSGNVEAITGVSCPTPTFCMATDNMGEALSFNGFTWSFSPPGQINSDFDNLGDVSCSSANFCVAASRGPTASPFAGAAIVYQNGAWAAPLMLNPTKSNLGDIYAVSCVLDMCAAGSADGAMFIYQVPTPTIRIVTARSAVRGSRVSVAISCALGPCRGTVTLAGEVRVGSRSHLAVLATGHYALPLVASAPFAIVNLALTGNGSRAFARSTQRSVKVRVTATVSGGSPVAASLNVIAPR